MFRIKHNHGNLFKNKKSPESKAPDYTGSINIKGKVYELSGWINTTKNKDKYISITARELKNEK